jgi:hypothetical protein
MSNAPLAAIAVGVIAERVKSASEWADYIWRPVAVLAGQPDTALGTQLAHDGNRMTYYAGSAVVELYRTEAANYRSNLASGSPALWVVLRETGAEPPYALYIVTADPAEGEAMTEAGRNIVEPVRMPEAVCHAVTAFVTEYYVEEVFVKRKRDRTDIESTGRRPPGVRKESND